MAPPKKICLNGKTCSVGKVQESLCYGQRVLHRSELDVHCRKKHETSTICCCAELSINSGIRRFEATPTSEQRHQAPGAGKPEETRNQEGTRRESERPRATVVPATYPKFFFVHSTIFRCIAFFENPSRTS